MTEVIVLGSGSHGNATAICCDEAVLLVDAGFSAIELRRRLEQAHISPQRIVAILVSHEHSDHIQGLRVFARQAGSLVAYANALTADWLAANQAAPERLRVFTNGTPFTVGPFAVEAFAISHDAVDPVGFVVRAGGGQVGIVTDLGYAGQLVPLKLHNSHVLVIESNHDPELLRCSGRPPHVQHRIRGRRGHLSNQHAAELIPRVVGECTQHLIMAHLSEECNRPELVTEHIGAALRALARDDIQLQVAGQATIGRLVTLASI